MQLRKNRRELSGTKSRDKSLEVTSVAVVLAIVIGLTGWEREDELKDDEFVTLTFANCVVIVTWIFVAFVITTFFGESRFGELLSWMFVYLPLFSVVISFMFDTREAAQDQLAIVAINGAIGVLLLAAELLTVAIFFTILYAKPKLMNSEWFRGQSRAARYFRVNVVGAFTMTYRGGPFQLFTKRKACKYEGETNDKGEPHGKGRWYDDDYYGEVLVGTWQNGLPVGPFISRHFGRGDVFAAVRIALVQATDDAFNKYSFWPSNEKPMQCAIASVECSVSGSFYNNLPHAEILFGPSPFSVESSIDYLCSKLVHISSGEEPNMLQISASDPRGVSIADHVYVQTGKQFHDVDHVTVNIKRANNTRRPMPTFMPKSGNRSYYKQDRIRVREDAEDNQKEDDESEDEDMEEDSSPEFYLDVNDWTPAKHKEALIFFAGFNASQESACRSFGQFLAMTKLDTRVYPIIYAWPCGTALSYHPASRISSKEKNHQNLLQLFKGLQSAGIRTIHLMSHSMGVQTLVGAFCDKKDGSRSEVSRCFQLVFEGKNKTRGDTAEVQDVEVGIKDDADDQDLLVCKTFTMLNPDFPVVPFVTHAFRSIRRICRTITVVGDRTDGALYFSQLLNGIGVYFGYEQPQPLLPNDANKEHLQYLYVIGRNIDDLYLSKDQQQIIESKHSGDSQGKRRQNPLVFREKAPMSLVSQEEADDDKAWLDLDVIDTTGTCGQSCTTCIPRRKFLTRQSLYLYFVGRQ